MTVTQQIKVTIPTDLLTELTRYVSPRQQNQFILEGIEQALRRLRIQKAVDQSAGAWKAEDHPELDGPNGVEAYIRRLREAHLPRSWDEILAEDADG